MSLYGKLLIAAYFIFGAAALYGEVRCIYKFCTSDFEPNYKREIIYGISAATGVGAIVGYFDIDDKP